MGSSAHLWSREDNESELVIDLTLANRPITVWSIVADNHITGSCHVVIEWAVEADSQEEADFERVVGWNCAAMTVKDPEAVEMLWKELFKDTATLDAECTDDEVEQNCTWFQHTLSHILDPMAKIIRICTRSTRWWNTDITEASQVVGRET